MTLIVFNILKARIGEGMGKEKILFGKCIVEVKYNDINSLPERRHCLINTLVNDQKERNPKLLA